MTRQTILRVARIVAAGTAGGIVGCRERPPPQPVIGAWVVRHSAAPFQYHMYVFNADGTMQQANPDAGNARTSDSDGKGIWVADGDTVRGKFVEVRADRATHAYVGKGEISFRVVIRRDSLIGTASARFFNPADALVDGPIATDMIGSRVGLP